MTRQVTKYDKQMLAEASQDLTVRQRAFVDNLFTPGVTNEEAAVAAGYGAKNAAVAASRNLRIPKVLDYLNVCMDRGFRTAAPSALSVVTRMSDAAKTDTVRLQAAQDILDRAGYKPVDKQVVGVVGTIEVNIDLS